MCWSGAAARPLTFASPSSQRCPCALLRPAHHAGGNADSLHVQAPCTAEEHPGPSAHRGAGANEHVVANLGVAVARLLACAPQRHVLCAGRA